MTEADRPPSRPWRRALVLAIVVGSVGWAVVHRPPWSDLADEGGHVAVLLGALVVINTGYAGGLVLAAVAVARHAGGADGVRSWRRHVSMRRWTDELLARVHDDRLFRLGFALNGVTAVLAALVPPVAVVTVLPPEAWSLLAVSVLDVAGAVALRVAVRRRMRRAVAATQGPPGAGGDPGYAPRSTQARGTDG